MVFLRRFLRSVPTRTSVPPKDIVEHILTAARRLLPNGPAAYWIAAWALARRGWRMHTIARALRTDRPTIILAIVRVRHTPEFLALARSLVRSRLDDRAARPDHVAVHRGAKSRDETQPALPVRSGAGEPASPCDPPQVNSHPYRQ